ncbi:TonB-dependent receptor [Novosphingobium sp. G106]|uniref:TonB-dependent receptor n=1 Tax=Novosphingobium sp. G106 TaxID=2849500 RepID=UPI0020C46013|nr:TonB-dependent receptor [Novosphingobium sp. G106]
MAQSSDDSATGDIIVTAQRVEQRLQDVPISITVFNQDQLTKRNVAVAADLAAYTPSLSINQRYGPEKSNFNIRGFNQDQNTAPTVGVYFAEVVGVRAQGGTTSGNSVGAGTFTDLQNVQVLKGPQGTLFGRNTTGGAILLTPKKPGDNLEGYVQGTYGNYDNKRVEAAINIPLADTFKIRLAVDRNKRDGFMKNLARNAAGNRVGPDAYNDLDYTYARLSIVADLTPDLENYTIFHYSKSTTNGYASRIVGCAQPVSQGGDLNIFSGTAGYSGTRDLQATSCNVQLARQNARGDSLYDIETSNANPFLDITTWQVINTTTWKASDHITIKNIASYGEFQERANFDLGSANFVVNGRDVGGTLTGAVATGFNLRRISSQLPNVVTPNGTPYGRIVLDTAGPNTANAAQGSFTEELQIQGSWDKLNFVMGGYLEFARPTGFSTGRTGIFLNCSRPQDLACSNPLLFGSISESATKLNFDNNGIFGQATYNFSDKLALTGGIRYTFDKIVGLTQGTRAGFSANATTGPLFADPVSGVNIARACTDSFRHNRVGPAADPAVVANPPAADRSVCTTTLTNKSSKPTWVIDLDFKPSQDLLFYAKYARGYRQGGLNFTNPGVESWKPEKTDNFEAGAKVSFRGAVSGYLNLAGFYNKIVNQQVFAGLTPDALNAALGVSGGNAVVNAGKSRIYGAEVDASATFFESLRFDLGYTYLDTKITAGGTAAVRGDGSQLGQLIVGSPFGTITPTSIVGKPFANTPKHRVTLTGSYTLPLDESIGRISFGATWVHTSSAVNDYSVPAFVNGIAVGYTPANDLVNLNLDWKGIAGSTIDAALFVTNLTKERYTVANGGGWNSAGVAEILLNQPRFYGVRLRYNFGQ